MKKYLIIIVLISFLIAVAIWIVSRNIPESNTELKENINTDVEDEERINVQKDENTILIGAISAKTGDAQEINKFMYIALRHAVDELNSRGGILDKQVKILELDNGSTSLGSKQAAQDAVKAEVVAVIGALRSSHSLAAAPILQKAGIPMISPESTNPKVTEVGDYIFRICFIDPFQGEVLAKFAIDDLKAETAATITNANRIFSIGLSEFFEKSFESAGGEFLYNGDYLDTEADYKEILTTIKDLKPDVIMVPSEVRDSGFIIKQARKMGIDSIFLGPDSWGERLFLFANETAEGSYFSTHWHRDMNTEVSKSFVRNYLKIEESIKRAVIPLTYDSLALLADAIERAGTLDRKIIRDQLAVTEDFEGITGTITFDSIGNPIGKSAVILKLTNNTTVFHKTVETTEKP